MIIYFLSLERKRLITLDEKDEDDAIYGYHDKKKQGFVLALFGNDSEFLRENIKYPYGYQGPRHEGVWGNLQPIYNSKIFLTFHLEQMKWTILKKKSKTKKRNSYFSFY